MVKPSEWLAKRIGNAYTASLWSSLAALMESKGDELVGERILLFSYGSGLASSMFTLRVVGSLSSVVPKLLLKERLDARTLVSPEEYTSILKRKEEIYGSFDVRSTQEPSELWPESSYLVEVDALGRRFYSTS